jgi:hypothetical protein
MKGFVNNNYICKKSNQMRKVTDQELAKIQEMNTDFNKSKMALGDLELQKQNIIRHVDSLKKEFAEHEKMLIEKYGIDSVINVQTGEITQKQNDTK